MKNRFICFLHLDIFNTFYRFRMNDVEKKHAVNELESLRLNSLADGNFSNVANETSDIASTIITNLTAPTSTITPNLTVIGTMMKTAFAIQNITTGYEEYNHEFYIYIWGIAIFACIVLTTGRWEN